jgi:ACR3 family arsenite efflux pump ArsB
MKYVLSAVLLAVAVALEVAGISGAGALVLGAGVACEIWFWIRLVRSRRRLRSPSFEV